MATRKTRVQIDTVANTKGAEDAAKAIDEVDKAAEKANTTQTKGADEAAGSQKNLAYQLGQVGLQAQDVGVQAQMGTDAVRILGQQGPQIASIFGPGGAIAGAAIALGAILVDSLVDKWLGELERGTEEAKERFQELASELEEALGEKAARAVAEFGHELEQQDHMFKLLNQSALDALDIAQQRQRMEVSIKEEVRQSAIEQIKLLDAMGKIEDAQGKIAAIQAESRQAADQQKIVEAEQQIERAVEERAKGFDEIAKINRQIAESEEQVVALQERQLAVGKALAQAKREAQQQGDKEVEALQEDAGFRAAQAEAEALKESIQAERDRQQELSDSIAEVKRLMDQRAQQIDQQVAALELLKEGVAALGEQREIQNDLKAAVAGQKAVAKDLTDGVKDFTTASSVQAQAVELIRQAASDGVVTAQESRQIGTQLSILISTLTSNQQGTLRELQRLQTTVNDYGRQLEKISKQSTTPGPIN